MPRRWTLEDAAHLRRAAEIIRGRSRKPRGLWMAVFCRILTDQATKIEHEVWNYEESR